MFSFHIILESLKQLLLWSASLQLWTTLLFLTEQQVEPFSVSTFFHSHTVQGCCYDFICTCFINCLGHHLMALIHVADTVEIILSDVKTTGIWPSYFQFTWRWVVSFQLPFIRKGELFLWVWLISEGIKQMEFQTIAIVAPYSISIISSILPYTFSTVSHEHL